MSSLELTLTLILTAIITTLIVLGIRWIEKNKEKHPEIFKNRGIIGAVVWLLLQGGDFK
jgi:hypothetical protein